MTVTSEHLDAVIVGAGFGGMGAAIELLRAGYDNLVIVDREDDLGGTWYVNHYPGLAVDIPSTTYSYWFEPNPYWSRLHAPGEELKRYADHVAEKYDLRRFMRFSTTVDGARWDEDAQVWRIALAGGDTLRARFLITATGFLSLPRVPDIPGVNNVRRQDGAYRGLGSRPAIDGQPRRRHRNGCDGSAVDSRIGEEGCRADGVPTHCDLGRAEGRLPDSRHGPADFRPVAAVCSASSDCSPTCSHELGISTAVLNHRKTSFVNAAAARAVQGAHVRFDS